MSNRNAAAFSVGRFMPSHDADALRTFGHFMHENADVLGTVGILCPVITLTP